MTNNNESIKNYIDEVINNCNLDDYYVNNLNKVIELYDENKEFEFKRYSKLMVECEDLLSQINNYINVLIDIIKYKQ